MRRASATFVAVATLVLRSPLAGAQDAADAPRTEDAAPTGPPAADVSRVAVLASLDVGFALDGASPNGQPGALARIAVDLGPAELALEAHGGGPDTIESTRVAIHVARGAIRFSALLEALDDGEWRIPIGLAIGLSGWARLSTTHDPALEATGGATSGGFTAGAVMRVQWLPRALGGVVGLELGLGLDLVVPSPRFLVDDVGTTTTLATLWPVSPHASFGIVVRGRP